MQLIQRQKRAREGRATETERKFIREIHNRILSMVIARVVWHRKKDPKAQETNETRRKSVKWKTSAAENDQNEICCHSQWVWKMPVSSHSMDKTYIRIYCLWHSETRISYARNNGSVVRVRTWRMVWLLPCFCAIHFFLYAFMRATHFWFECTKQCMRKYMWFF